MVTVRPLRDEDVPAVVASHINGWRTAYKGIVADEVLDGLDQGAWAERRRTELTKRAAGESPWQTLVVLDGDQVVGHVSYGPYRTEDGFDPEVGEILAIYVDPPVYGQGFGRALLTAALAELPQAEVRLWILEENERARRFYEKAGLRPDGVREFWSPAGTTFRYPELRYHLVR
ncbi:MAG: N-acetyltransferase [Hamadaea sp.]|nr:N-acetyltransferase [Hamadaea sp.]NUT08224.1 N-acetyltransferase [Hamadaea sp.]